MKGTRSFQVYGGEPHAIAKTSPDRGGLVESDPAESEFAELLEPIKCEHCGGPHVGSACLIVYPEGNGPDACTGCGSSNCARLWPLGKKCCPDCSHGAPGAAGGE